MTFVVKKVTFVTADNSYNKKDQLRKEAGLFCIVILPFVVCISCAFRVHNACFCCTRDFKNVFKTVFYRHEKSLYFGVFLEIQAF